MTPMIPAARHTITTLGQARSYVQSLITAGLLYHFEDGALDCLGHKLTVAQCENVDHNVAQLYEIDELKAQYIDPLGLALELEGHPIEDIFL